MIYTPEASPHNLAPSTPLVWVAKHAREIKTDALAYRKQYKPVGNRTDLSETYRELSEMPLCMSLGTIADRYNLAQTGLEVILGNVTVYAPGTDIDLQGPHQHMYYQETTPNGSQLALCFFPGQFVLSVDSTRPERGQRIQQLQELADRNGASDLIQHFPDSGITFLYGATERIRKALGLEYNNKPLQSFY